MASRIAVIGKHLEKTKLVPAETNALQLQTTFRYTVDPCALTKQQRDQYEKDGFVVIKRLVPEADLDKYRERFQGLCDGTVPTDNMTLMRDVAIAKSEYKPGERAITKLQNFQDDEVLYEYISHPEIVKVAKNFVGGNVMAMHTMLINKPPDPGTKSSRHPMHQDLHYFAFRPADRIVCAWTAMQHIDRENGCLVVIPGSHRSDRLYEHGYPQWEGGVNKMYYGITDYTPKEGDRVHLVMEAGDTVFFHPLLVHGSGMNKTKGFRKSISCHYAASECQYIDVDGTSQEMLNKEIFEVAKRKFFGKDAVLEPDMIDFLKKEVTITKHWAAKAKCVAGHKVNM